MRALYKGILVIVGLVVIALIAVFLDLSHIVKSVVQDEGTKSLRLGTTLETARAELFAGKVRLDQLAIASPRGFEAPHMLEAHQIDLDATYSQLRRNPIHVSALRIDQPRLVIEQSGGAINFRKAMELLPASDPHKPPLKLVIDELQIKDATVVIRPGLPGLQQEVTVPVPELSMKNIGRGKGAQNGAAIKEVAMQVISALATRAAASDRLPPELKAVLHLNAAEIATKLGGEALKGVAAQVPGELGKSLGNVDAGKALKGLIPQGREAPAASRPRP